MNKQGYSASDIVFLLGAGATVDAGMPTIKDLTQCIRERLPYLKDVNGKKGFEKLFDTLAGIDPDVNNNYERFFEYLQLITRATGDREKHLFTVSLSADLLDRAGHLPYVIGDLVKEIFYELQDLPSQDYLFYLDDFIPAQERLKVFTLNYDLCVENACINKGISLTTGFGDAWQPDLFSIPERGINLYKLHGSLTWITDKNWKIREMPTIQKNRTCEIVLGPGSKLQSDDPFVTLFCEFHKAMQSAKVCVVIGYGYQDTHVNTVFERSKVNIVDVNIKHADILNKTNKQY